MSRTSATIGNFANELAHKTGPSRYQIGAINEAIVRIIKQIYAQDTVKILSGWIGVSLKTAKNRICAQREFSLDEVATLLSSDHGFRVLSAIMEEAAKRPNYRAPDWWEICEPLMELADAERLCEAVRKRTDKVI